MTPETLARQLAEELGRNFADELGNNWGADLSDSTRGLFLEDAEDALSTPMIRGLIGIAQAAETYSRPLTEAEIDLVAMLGG